MERVTPTVMLRVLYHPVLAKCSQLKMLVNDERMGNSFFTVLEVDTQDQGQMRALFLVTASTLSLSPHMVEGAGVSLDWCFFIRLLILFIKALPPATPQRP